MKFGDGAGGGRRCTDIERWNGDADDAGDEQLGRPAPQDEETAQISRTWRQHWPHPISDHRSHSN